MYWPGTATVAERAVVLRVFCLESGSDRKGIDDRGFAAGAVEVETVQHLGSRCIVGIGAVRMRPQLEVGVRRIGFGEIGGEVPETSEDRFTHVGDAFQQRLAVGNGDRCVSTRQKPNSATCVEPMRHADFGVHHCIELNARNLGGQTRLPSQSVRRIGVAMRAG